MRRLAATLMVLAVAAPAAATPPPDPRHRVSETLEQNEASIRIEPSAAAVSYFRGRIDTFDPRLRSVIAVNPDATTQAEASDRRRIAAGRLGPLEGAVILVKDNIETLDPIATTAGSLALSGNVTGRDAPVVARLRAAGVVVLGKTNLSEWANIRSEHSLSGWSAVGGQTRNPYDLSRSPCGSSSGSAVAVTAGLAQAALGTETDGSITCPAAVNGLVGLKPTVGLVSRTHIVPISASQDTAGPMTQTVKDAAMLLTAMAGSDPADPATREADARRQDYVAGLKPDALKGVRIGVMRYAAGFHPETDAVFAQALKTLEAQGATLVEIDAFPNGDKIGGHEMTVLMTELKAGLNAYLASTDPEKVKTRSLADLIRFNRSFADKEMALFGQDLFERAEATKGLDDPAYRKAKAEAHRLAGPEGIDALLAKHRVSALVGPTLAPAWPIDPVLKDRYVGGGAGNAAAVAGYPHLTVPMGVVQGLPVGLSFVGAKWSDGLLLAYGYAYEQAAHARRKPVLEP
ncbi:amidase [Caulobacter mirabilis]|nr:amidase [Caulobacter mirabilis]